MEDKLIKDVPIEVIVIDNPNEMPNNNPNLIPVDDIKDTTYEETVTKRVTATLKSGQTRRGRNEYKKSVQSATKALMEGTYCALQDGSIMTGAEIIAVQLFERALHSDKSAKILLQLTGDLSDKEANNENSYEEFVKNVTPQF